MSWHVSPWVYPVWDSVPLGLLTIFFSKLGEFSTIISSKVFSYPFFFYSSSGAPIIQMLVNLILSQSLRVSSVLFILFTVFCSSEVIFIILSSRSLIHSSASDILLLIPSRVLLISVIVLFVSVSLFFKSSLAAKSLQSCPTLCDPIDGSPSGSPIPGILQARTLEWVAISFYNARK